MPLQAEVSIEKIMHLSGTTVGRVVLPPFFDSQWLEVVRGYKKGVFFSKEVTSFLLSK
jgi:hypothetical protein